MTLNPQYARSMVLLLASSCALFSVGVLVFEPLIQVFVHSLAIFPLGLAVIWYLLGEVPESRGYGVTALAAAAASMSLGLSTLVGPLLPVIVGLLLLGFLKRDPVLCIAGVAAMAATILADGGHLLASAAQGSDQGAPGEMVYTVLTMALTLAASGAMWAARRGSAGVAADTHSQPVPDHPGASTRS